jgi:hypothetical protein
MHATPEAPEVVTLVIDGATLFTVTVVDETVEGSLPSVTFTLTVDVALPSGKMQLNEPAVPTIDGVPNSVPFVPHEG